MNNLLNQFQQSGEKIINQLKEELSLIRTGRASSSLIENIIVETYQGQTKLKLLELATITTEGPQTLIVQPFDPSVLQDIEKAVSQSSLNLNPIVQSNRVLIKLPSLTEEQRKKLLKLTNQKIEYSRIQVRNQRDESRKKIRNYLENKEISEDEKYKFEKEIDKITQDLNDKIAKIKEQKEKGIMEI